MSGIQCFLCHKGVMTGKQHKHHPGVAGGRWKRRAPKTVKRFIPNLHVAHIMVGKINKKVRLCTKCLRKAKGKTSMERSKAKKMDIIGVQSAPLPQLAV